MDHPSGSQYVVKLVLTPGYILANSPPDTPGGYHGYWASDLYAINSNYGSADDLKRLVAAAHDRVRLETRSFWDERAG